MTPNVLDCCKRSDWLTPPIDNSHSSQKMLHYKWKLKAGTLLACQASQLRRQPSALYAEGPLDRQPTWRESWVYYSTPLWHYNVVSISCLHAWPVDRVRAKDTWRTRSSTSGKNSFPWPGFSTLSSQIVTISCWQQCLVITWSHVI